MATILRHFIYNDLPQTEDHNYLNLPAHVVFTPDPDGRFLDVKIEGSPGVSGFQLIRIQQEELQELFLLLLTTHLPTHVNYPVLIRKFISQHPYSLKRFLHNLIDQI